MIHGISAQRWRGYVSRNIQLSAEWMDGFDYQLLPIFVAGASEKIVGQTRISAQCVIILQCACATICGAHATPVIMEIIILDISRGLEVISITLEDAPIF